MLAPGAKVSHDEMAALAVKLAVKRPTETNRPLIGADFVSKKWCRRAESNCRHRDFQSRDLPLSYPGTIRILGMAP